MKFCLECFERMKAERRNNGMVFLITVFVIALLAVLTMGILQMNTEEIQLMQNQVNAAEALATAEAGLNDAFSQLRSDSSWTTGFTDKAFNGGSYTVTVADSNTSDLLITSTGTSSQSFVGRVEADITIGQNTGQSFYAIRIDNLRINE